MTKRRGCEAGVTRYKGCIVYGDDVEEVFSICGEGGARRTEAGSRTIIQFESHMLPPHSFICLSDEAEAVMIR